MDKLLQQFIKDYSLQNKNVKRVNKDLIHGMRNESLIEYIIDAYKSLEIIRHIKLLDYEHITNESEFDIDVVNRKHLKSKLNKNIKKFIYIDESRYSLLKARFKLSIQGETKIKEVRLLLPKRYKDYYILLGGNKFYPIYQLVDSSTYNNKDYVTLKTMFMPIILKRNVEKLTDINKKEFTVPYYSMFLFKKKTNPLIYYLATIGFENTLRYMSMEDIISVTPNIDETDDEHYYFKSSKLYIKVIKEFFDEDYFIQSMTFSLVKVISMFKPSTTSLNDVNFWCKKLGSLFTSNPAMHLDKGKNVILSFYRLLDKTTYKNLKLKEFNKNNIYAIVRWMMKNFSDLKAKDNMDLKNKRIRLWEYVAFYFIKRLSIRANKLLSSRSNSITMDDLEDLLNFPQDDLIKQIYKSKSPLLRYDNTVNNFDLFTALKFSSKGPGAIGENSSNAINIKYRGIHASHEGRIDINTSGTSDPGMSGMFTPFVETYGQFFDPTPEPQGWDKKFKKFYKEYFGEKYKSEGLKYFYLDPSENNLVYKYEDIYHFIKYDRYYYEFNDILKLNDIRKIDVNRKKKKRVKKIKVRHLEKKHKKHIRNIQVKKL